MAKTNPELILNEIQDLYLRRNFSQLDNYFKTQNQLLDFKFFEVKFTATTLNQKVNHGLKFIPKDVVFLGATNNATVSFNVGNFNLQSMDISANKETTLRFFIGKYFNDQTNAQYNKNDVLVFGPEESVQSVTNITEQTTVVGGAKNVVAKTTTYTATTSDDVINASGSAFTITLYPADGNSGSEITIKKTDASLANIITIEGNGSETIDGSLTTTLNTQYESVTLYCDGANWFVKNRTIPSYVGSFTPTGSWTTNTTYTGKKRRIGDSYEYSIKVSTSGAPTAAALIIQIPDVIDTTKLNSTLQYASSFESSGQAYDSGNGYPVKVLYSTTTSQVAIATAGSPEALVGNTTPFVFGAGDEINVRFTLPIVGLSN